MKNVAQHHVSLVKQPSTPVLNVQEAKDLIVLLESELKEYGDEAIGLAAIQIGIPKTIAVLRYPGHPNFCLINPIVKTQEDEFLFRNEGCLSFPNQFVDTKRYAEYVIVNQKINETGDGFEEEELYFYYSSENQISDIMTVAVQHEIDHFSGKTIFENKYELKPIVKPEKVGRNDPCPCGSNKKFKKCCLK